MSERATGFQSFDAGKAASATPVWLIRQDQMGDVEALAGPAAAKMTRLSGFKGDLGVFEVFDTGVLVGAGDGADPLALGAGAANLPAGDYRLESEFEGEALYLALLGWGLGAYRFDTYKDMAPVPTLILPEGVDEARLKREVEATYLVRDLVNTPAEEMGPDALEDAVRALAEQHGAQVETIIGENLEKGFPMIHAVGRAAAIPPRLLDLRWGPEDGPQITLVGKGVCFDSGGLNIKGAAGMLLMKKDMGGAANALGLAKLIMAANLPVKLRVLIPAVENAISGNAFRPGDVFRARNDMSVEISNTDAEGRLILSDALALASEENPTRIISLATLTGAARVALGPDLPPIYSTDEAFGNHVAEISRSLADPVWPMPLWSRYEEFLASDIADINHAANTTFAGSITAALFLTKFVPEAIPYTHLDIFAWTPTARPARPKGGEAMAIRALFRALEETLS